jgi:hypothetical protein
VIDPAEYHYCMSAFPTFPRGQPITNEEARAAVETELFAMKLTKPMTPAEKDAFCEIAKSRLNYESNSYRIKEIRLWVESWQSLWLPEKLGAGVGMVDTAASEFGLVVPFPRWTRIILRTLDAWRAAVGTFVYRLARSPHHEV